MRASAEATPHHLCLTDEAVRSLDTNLKMNPPLRPEEDRRALIKALNDGAISCIATDHAPHARQEKDVPFEAAPFGVTGLETAFAALYTNLVEPGLVSLETLGLMESALPEAGIGVRAALDAAERVLDESLAQTRPSIYRFRVSRRARRPTWSCSI